MRLPVIKITVHDGTRNTNNCRKSKFLSDWTDRSELKSYTLVTKSTKIGILVSRSVKIDSNYLFLHLKSTLKLLSTTVGHLI